MFVNGDMEMDPQWLTHGTTFLRESPHACGVSGIRDDMRQITGAFQLIQELPRGSPGSGTGRP